MSQKRLFKALLRMQSRLHALGDVCDADIDEAYAEVNRLGGRVTELTSFLRTERTKVARLEARLLVLQGMALECARDIERDYRGWARSWREVAP